MLFNSYEFILLYLPFTLIVYYAIAYYAKTILAKYFLICMSLVFYSYWDIKNLPILLFSIACNYCFALNIKRYKTKFVLFLGISFNLLYLAYYKYTGFLLENFNSLFSMNLAIPEIILPLGISFFTFTQTAYLVDVYRGGTDAYSKSDCLLFVTIFPHLIAGPILYHKDMIPQFSETERYRIDYRNLAMGLVWFIIGLLKKVRIADSLGEIADVVFNNTDSITMMDAWFGSLAYSLQLYFDFSGYSEMAIGLGLMFNYNLPANFDMPYRSCSIIEFWRKWHMTLSAFLKNYLYIPLGGNRNNHHLRNIFLTMLLGGLWHGAGWTFVLWGALHGIFICINHLWRKAGKELPRFFNWVLTFNAVNFAWIFFRADSIAKAQDIVLKMIDIESLSFPHSKILMKYFTLNDCFKGHLTLNNILFITFFLFICTWLIDSKDIIQRFKPNYYWMVGLGLTVSYLLLFMGNVDSQFIYFQF